LSILQENTEEMQEVYSHHLQHFSSRVWEANIGIQGREYEQWLTWLNYSQDNCRVAMQYALSHPSTAEFNEGFSIASGLARYCHLRGLLQEELEILEKYLALSQDNVPIITRARGNIGACVLSWFRGDYEKAMHYCLIGEPLARGNDDWSHAISLIMLGALNTNVLGDAVTGNALYDAAIAITEHSENLWLKGLIFSNHDIIKRDWDAGIILLHKTDAILSQIGDPWIVALIDEGYAFYYTHIGDHEKARHYFLRCTEQQLVIGYIVGAAIALWGVAYSLYLQGENKQSQGDLEQAHVLKEKALLLLWGAETMCMSRGLVKIPPMYAECQEILAKAEREMGTDLLAQIKSRGLQMTQEETVALASS
jgi:tetratricopeptide (TPR) repeat protein